VDLQITRFTNNARLVKRGEAARGRVSLELRARLHPASNPCPTLVVNVLPPS